MYNTIRRFGNQTLSVYLVMRLNSLMVLHVHKDLTVYHQIAARINLRASIFWGGMPPYPLAVACFACHCTHYYHSVLWPVSWQYSI